MKKQVEGELGPNPSEEADSTKLPYTKPAFRYEGVFETQALACGKISTTQAQCRSLLKTS
jgi:hypothetical protein